MNLKQLNGQGQNFWSFIVTAIVALLTTGFVWFFLFLYNVVVDHYVRMYSRPGAVLQRRISGVRVAVFLGLIKEEEEVDHLRRLGNG